MNCGCDAVKQSLTPVDEAIASLLAAARPVAETESVNITAALSRVLARPVVSGIKVPPLDNSAMDGYAVISQDVTHGGIVLPVSQRICAGDVGKPLQAGTVARIFTGAAVPPNADAVVMQEFCELKDDGVTIKQQVRPGQNILQSDPIFHRSRDRRAGA